MFENDAAMFCLIAREDFENGTKETLPAAIDAVYLIADYDSFLNSRKKSQRLIKKRKILEDLGQLVEPPVCTH